jgi:hypothetical protein
LSWNQGNSDVNEGNLDICPALPGVENKWGDAPVVRKKGIIVDS